ncbi:MAG: response regulator transcription factor [Burkholderiales bacterium]|nr:response regulator transcription factor [Burkholderiales bacterium]
MRILLVEDDPLLGEGVRAGLAQDDHAVDWVRDGAAADAALRAGRFALVILDLGLPRLAGLEVLRAQRARGDATPVLVLTARDAVADRIEGLDTGADDYLVKPFDLGELKARARALVRRAAGRGAPELRHGDLVVDPAAHTVRLGGAPVELSPSEFAVLHELLRNAGRVLSREQLEDSLYGFGGEIESNAVEVYVHRLRRKLGAGLIKTIRGVGYLVEKAARGG